MMAPCARSSHRMREVREPFDTHISHALTSPPGHPGDQHHGVEARTEPEGQVPDERGVLSPGRPGKVEATTSRRRLSDMATNAWTGMN